VIIHVVVCEDIDIEKSYAECAFYDLAKAEAWAKEHNSWEHTNNLPNFQRWYKVSSADILDAEEVTP
jgi:hypothetical protein